MTTSKFESHNFTTNLQCQSKSQKFSIELDNLILKFIKISKDPRIVKIPEEG